MRSKRKSAELENDYKWRKVKTAYLAISVILVVAIGFGVQAANNAQTCGETPAWANDSGGPDWAESSGQPGFDCTSRAQIGKSTSMSVLFIPTVILVIGYRFFLPKAYRYLSPPLSKDS